MSSRDPGQIYAEASALQRANRAAEAEPLYRRILELDPNHVGALHMLGVLELQRGLAQQAAELIGRAVTLDDRSVPRHFNLALALYQLDRFDEAIAACRAALRLKADFAPALYTMALSLKDLGRLDEAIAAYQAAQSHAPNLAEAHYGEGFARLMKGDFAAGWRKFEWRRHIFPQRTNYPQPQWTGQDIGGRTLLIHGEQGQGDNIHFLRYAPLAAERGAKVIVETYASLVPLMRSLPGVERVIGFGDPAPRFDFHCPAMSLPALFGPAIPSAAYLSADPARTQAWRERLAALPGRKIGIAWRGNPEQSENKRRSLSAGQMAACFAGGTAVPVCLQKDRTAEELAAFGPLIDAAPDLADFAETAALIGALDLVLTVDTAVCHLAGALGAPVWTLLSFAPDWRWQEKREDSPWYPSMRLFRQARPGEWGPAIDKVRAALNA